MRLTPLHLDRAVGAVLGSAAGDALGSQYEFGPALSPETPVTFGRGSFGHDVGEWTDDTAMAMPLLQALSRGESLQSPAVLGGVVDAWKVWARDAKDVGAQTSAVLGALRSPVTEDAARTAAYERDAASGRSGGNGSLMRTGPVALGYLHDGAEADLVEAAGRVAQLTHWEDDNVDACAIWCLAIRHAIRTGELDVAGQVAWIPAERRERWAGLISTALEPDVDPAGFGSNGWVVAAFQCALAAINATSSLVEALERAVRGGHDTDTVAAITGSLAGALYGGTQVPVPWHLLLHGWPGIDVTGLTRMAVSAARGGVGDAHDWPRGDREPVYPRSDTLVRHPADDGVWLGSIAALDRLAYDAPQVDAVVSLCRVGTTQVPSHCRSVQVWLVDQDGKNLNLEQTLTGAAQVIADLRAQGHTVLLHCAEARSRTSAVAMLYAAQHCGQTLDEAWAAVQGALPHFAPAPFLQDALRSLMR